MPYHTRYLGAYRLTLTARLATGSAAYASVALLVNAPPYGGTLILTLTLISLTLALSLTLTLTRP